MGLADFNTDSMFHDFSIFIFFQSNFGFSFYPREAMLTRVIAIATCLSVRPSVCHAPVLCQNEERHAS